MPAIVSALLTMIQYAPGAISEITALYNVVKADISSDDQVSIDNALTAAQASDAAATAQADAALDAASKV